VLVLFDAADARIVVAQAQAEYARVLSHVQQYFEENKTAAAQVTYAQAVLDQASADLARRTRLSGSGAISPQDLSNAQAAFNTATAALNVARRQQDAQQALTGRGDVANHPEVMAARAAVDSAQLALERTVVRAPIDGTVIQKRVALGQRLQSGAAMLSLVPLDRVYVVANYKESQLERVHIGQPVTLSSDLYGSAVSYHGQVVGLSGGTGSAFSIIPAQNATGSWIKVVQRLPVRIDLDPAELRAHPLRVGLSMHTRIDVRR
jgi:membrane fusion protein (multidrug efflux system)